MSTRTQPPQGDLAAGSTRNGWRERLKAELESLRSQAWHLGTELLALQHPRTAPVVLAEQHRQSLAAHENRRLRVALAHQIEIAKGLIEALAGLSVDKLGLDLFSDPRTWAADRSPLYSIPDGFALLLSDVDHAHGTIDAIFGPAPPVEFPKALTSGFFTREADGRNELVLETRTTATTHLKFETFCSTLWRAIQQAPWHGFEINHEKRDSWADVVAIRVRFVRALRGRTLHLSSRLLIKRFVETDRLELVWRSVTTVENDSELADLFVEDTGFARFSRIVNGDTRDEAVVREKCIHSVPRAAGNRAIHEQPLAGSFTDLVLSASYGAVAAIDEQVESMLIDECMDELAAMDEQVESMLIDECMDELTT